MAQKNTHYSAADVEVTRLFRLIAEHIIDQIRRTGTFKFLSNTASPTNITPSIEQKRIINTGHICR